MFTTLIDPLACPHCHHTLKILDAHTGLMCPQCRMVYPIHEGIPLLSREAAVTVSHWGQGARLPSEQFHNGLLSFANHTENTLEKIDLAMQSPWQEF